jgi:hypothetical protein
VVTLNVKCLCKIFWLHSVEILLNDLKDRTFFSVATDASNKGNSKCYSVVVKYFSKRLV